MTKKLIFLTLVTILVACSPVANREAENDGVPVAQAADNISLPTTTSPPFAMQATSLTMAEAPMQGSSSSDDVAMLAPAEPLQPEPKPETMIFEDYGVNPFIETAQDNLSTFAMDVDTASYTLARNYLLQYNQLPPNESIRVEEFINYYPVSYPQPQGDHAFAIDMQASSSPFADENQILMRVGIQGRSIAPEDRDPALLIFVIDVSGSMASENRLGLAKQSLEILVEQLREDDRVGIVIYADEARIVLEPTPASEQQTIISAIQSLQTEGSTYAEAGLAMAYDMAQANMRDGQTTRVVLVSDGVANVGATGPDAILDTISEGVESGITLSTVGVVVVK
ncbi:MAG: von Willebrand factor type A domain-containing protein [Chloroflexota bacterium]